MHHPNKSSDEAHPTIHPMVDEKKDVNETTKSASSYAAGGDIHRTASYADGEYHPYPIEAGPQDAGAFPQAHATGTKRNIKSRHAQMMAIGGAIGTSLFLGTGQALFVGGPAFLFLAYCLMSFLVYGMLTSIVEVATFLPLPGSSMAYFASRFVSPSLGFALGWLYFYAFGIVVAYEITAASIIIDYWPNNVHTAVWITLMMVVIVGLNFSPVGVYAETEFWFAGIKIVMILGLLVLSVVLMAGGGPTHDSLGFRYWQDPGAMKTYIVGGDAGRFTAFLYVWVWSTFSFNFSAELMALSAGEMRQPRKNLPRTARHFFVRMVVFYMLSMLAVGAICSSTTPGLTTGAGNANASPWVIAIQSAGIRVLPSVINAGILTSAWSAGNAYLYMSSRALYSLAVAGNAPRIFARCNRFGLPVYAVLAASLFAPLAYMDVGKQAGVVFNWFVSMTNTAGYTSWIVCCVVYLRFRKACVAQGVKLPWTSFMQPWGSYMCMVFFSILLLCNGFTVFYAGQWSVSGFMTAYIGIALFVALYVGHKATTGRNDRWWRHPSGVDLVTGLREVEAEEKAEDEAEVQQREALGQGASRTIWQKTWQKITLLWE